MTNIVNIGAAILPIGRRYCQNVDLYTHQVRRVTAVRHEPHPKHNPQLNVCTPPAHSYNSCLWATTPRVFEVVSKSRSSSQSNECRTSLTRNSTGRSCSRRHRPTNATKQDDAAQRQRLSKWRGRLIVSGPASQHESAERAMLWGTYVR